jgi:hypothetical protein
LGWQSGLSGRTPAKQAQSPEFKCQYTIKKIDYLLERTCVFKFLNLKTNFEMYFLLKLLLLLFFIIILWGNIYWKHVLNIACHALLNDLILTKTDDTAVPILPLENRGLQSWSSCSTLCWKIYTLWKVYLFLFSVNCW